MTRIPIIRLPEATGLTFFNPAEFGVKPPCLSAIPPPSPPYCSTPPVPATTPSPN